MPQVLKTEIKQSILDNAMDCFIEKGFRATSMKEIAQRSGIAVGNIYNYFKNKTILYDTIAQPVLDEINNLFNVPPKVPIASQTDMKIHKFIEIYSENTKVFVMVLKNDTESDFEAVLNTLIINFSDLILKTKLELTKTTATEKNIIFIKSITGAYINGIISIMKQKIDENTKLEILHDFLTMMKNALINEFGFTRKD